MEMNYCQNIFVKSVTNFDTFIFLEDINSNVIAFRCCSSNFLFRDLVTCYILFQSVS